MSRDDVFTVGAISAATMVLIGILIAIGMGWW